MRKSKAWESRDEIVSLYVNDGISSTEIASRFDASCGTVLAILRAAGVEIKPAGDYIRTPEERFWKLVTKSDGCWNWNGKLRMGYGAFYAVNRDSVTGAHRFSWKLHFGDIPDGQWVLHKCDNPPCVRPDHLFLGTRQENLEDMRRKGRNKRGESSHLSKITEKQALEIIRLLSSGLSVRETYLSLGLSWKIVRQIHKGLTWKHLPR